MSLRYTVERELVDAPRQIDESRQQEHRPDI